MLNYTMNHIEQGVIILGENNQITLANRSAEKQLNMEELDKKTLPLDFDEVQFSVEDDERIHMLKDLENKEIEKTLKRFGITTSGKREAARSLGIELATLYRKMETTNSHNENLSRPDSCRPMIRKEGYGKSIGPYPSFLLL